MYLGVALSEQSDNNTGGPLRSVSAQINTMSPRLKGLVHLYRSRIGLLVSRKRSGFEYICVPGVVSPQQTTSLFDSFF